MTGLFDALDQTWPAAAAHRAGPWVVREGRGGGKRVSAATAAGDWTDADIPLARAMQARLGQDDLFMLRQGEDDLDAALAAQGYKVVDPVVHWLAPVAALTDALPPLAAFPHWPPLRIAADIWDAGGIGPARLAVMDRVQGAHTAILARLGDRSAGVCFVALASDGRVAMVHALEVPDAQRRQGVGRVLMQAAANWAAGAGAVTLALAVTRGNAPANALYASLGMAEADSYHYRLKPR